MRQAGIGAECFQPPIELFNESLQRRAHKHYTMAIKCFSVHIKMTEAVENETTDDDRNKVRVASHPFSLLIWMGLVKLLGKPKEIGSS